MTKEIEFSTDYALRADSMSWKELSELTHGTQVETFGFCSCEDNEGEPNPYEDCPEGN